MNVTAVPNVRNGWKTDITSRSNDDLGPVDDRPRLVAHRIKCDFTPKQYVSRCRSEDQGRQSLAPGLTLDQATAIPTSLLA